MWTSTVAAGATRILPDGCIDLIWNDGDLFVLADVAIRAGYADQSHLARDVKDLAGIPLGELQK